MSSVYEHSTSLVPDPTDSSAGVSVAPVADSDRSATPRAIDHAAFKPRTSLLIVGLVLIVGSAWVPIAMNASSVTILIAIFASSFLVGAATAVHNLLRWEHAESAYEKERTAAEAWHGRYMKLHAESSRTGTVLSHMTDGVVMLSPAQEIILINEAAKRLLAFPSDGIYLRRKFAELVRVPEIRQATDRVRRENVDDNVSVEIVDGAAVRPIAVRISRILDTSPPHLLLVLRDETEAQRVEAIRREFIANVSHELKTPLAAIKGYAETIELALDEQDAEAAKHFIAQVDQQCKRLEVMIADMMRLARAQSGKSTLLLQSIDLQKVVNQAMTSFSPVASAKEVELSVESHEGAIVVFADEEAAMTISQNLISNAIRHTDASGHVQVTFRNEKGGWTMSVQDDGVGIAPEFQERIFERFYRVRDAPRAHDGGTGIGLSIVKNLTRALNGTVRVISNPGEGATFEVWLPSPEY
ncbi:MAG: ATP-binding protein [Planctomycetota bacterium]